MTLALVAAPFVLAVSLAAAPTSPARTSSPTVAEVDRAVAYLAAADIYEAAHISYDGHVSVGGAALNVVRASPDAAARLRALATSSSTVAKLYAADGLRTLDPAAHASVMAALTERGKEIVNIHIGCDGGATTLAFILDAVR